MVPYTTHEANNEVHARKLHPVYVIATFAWSKLRPMATYTLSQFT
jgi:hypothetical protein